MNLKSHWQPQKTVTFPYPLPSFGLSEISFLGLSTIQLRAESSQPKDEAQQTRTACVPDPSVRRHLERNQTPHKSCLKRVKSYPSNPTFSRSHQKRGFETLLLFPYLRKTGKTWRPSTTKGACSSRYPTTLAELSLLYCH